MGAWTMKGVLRWTIRLVIGALQGGEKPDAITVFGRTLFLIDNPSPGLIAHEAMHRFQQNRDGWRYYRNYGLERLHKPYREISYEKEAYERQAQINAGTTED